MKLVIDTNRLIAALIKDSLCRSIILSSKFEFISPDFAAIEIEKHKQLILNKSGLGEKSFKIILSMLLEKINIHPISEYQRMMEKADIISDKQDIPFLALALATKAEGIWSDDKHFKEQNQLKIYSTRDLMNM
jgi:predicted nucleic acid-binding protein